MKIFYATAALLFAVFAGTEIHAAKLPKPQGDVVLTVTGNIANTNSEGEAQFDRAMLEALGKAEIITSTPWDERTIKYEGVLFKDLMDYVGAHGSNVNALALNDYGTDIPMSDIQEAAVILAQKADGQYMEVRDKGPIFVLYPYDSEPKYQTQTYYARSAWQVTKLTVE